MCCSWEQLTEIRQRSKLIFNTISFLQPRDVNYWWIRDFRLIHSKRGENKTTNVCFLSQTSVSLLNAKQNKKRMKKWIKMNKTTQHKEKLKLKIKILCLSLCRFLFRELRRFFCLRQFFFVVSVELFQRSSKEREKYRIFIAMLKKFSYWIHLDFFVIRFTISFFLRDLGCRLNLTDSKFMRTIRTTNGFST